MFLDAVSESKEGDMAKYYGKNKSIFFHDLWELQMTTTLEASGGLIAYRSAEI